jgi:hypothetical protein
LLLLLCFLQTALCLQTSTGEEAKGMTGDEYEDCMREFREKLHQEWVKYARQHPGAQEPIWLLSDDNDSAHTRARLDALGIWSKDHRFDLSALSPDLHKVVEHVHAYLDRAMQAWRRSLWPEKPSDEQCKEKLQQLFYAIPAKSIADDVDSLPATYQAVIDNAGLYAPAPLR